MVNSPIIPIAIFCHIKKSPNSTNQPPNSPPDKPQTKQPMPVHMYR